MDDNGRFRRTAAAAAVALLLGLAGPTARAEVTPGRVAENTKFGDVNDPLRGRDIPGLAVDPADPRHIVMIDEDFLAGQCDFHTSFDGGRTWTDGHLTVPSDFADPPCRTFDSGGYAHLTRVSSSARARTSTRHSPPTGVSSNGRRAAPTRSPARATR